MALAVAALAGGGCASLHPRTAAEGQAVFAALQQAIAAAGKQAEPSLVFVKVEAGGSPQRQVVGGITFVTGGAAGSSPSSGILLTAKGHVLVPGVIKADQDKQITVVIGDRECVARAVRSDETLGLTILKVDANEPCIPLDLSQGADLAVGEWAVVLKRTDEDLDYQTIPLLAVCQGEQVGRYRRYLLNQPSIPSGALVVNLAGRVVGMADKNSVLSINDIREDIQRLLTDAMGHGAADDDQQEKGWLGAMLEPVNKDYAKAKSLSSSSLQVLHVVRESPAAAAGLRDGDLIVALNGKPLRFTGNRARDYFLQSMHPRTGEKFALTALRGGKTLELSGSFAKRPDPETLRAEDLGISVSALTDSEVFGENLASDRGVLVTDVIRGSPAANSGSIREMLLYKNDVIVELAGRPTPTLAAFSKVLEGIRRDHPPVALVKYYRGLLTGYAGLNLALGEKDSGSKR